jgi:hypothetical protein
VLNLHLIQVVSAAELSPQIRVNKNNLKSQGINPEEIKSSIFLKFNKLPSEMQIQEQDSVTSLKLTGVQIFGDPKQGIWLRTNCDYNRRKFFLEECKGSVCQQTATLPPSKDEQNRRVFRGEFGNYTLTRARFAKQLLADGLLDQQLCKRNWPAWAVSARARSTLANLEFPKNLLIMQSAKEIFLIDALESKIWNSIPWNQERGLFVHATLAEDGRILLQGDQQSALHIDFARGSLIAVQNSSVYFSESGVNSLFSSSSHLELKQLEIETMKSSNSRSFINLGGIWSQVGFLTWQDLVRSAQLRSQPEWREYPEAGRLLSAMWSEESGVEKSYLLIEKDNQLKLYSASEQSRTFIRVKGFGRTESEVERGGYYIHPDFLTRITQKGQMWVNVSDKFFSDTHLNENPFVMQAGSALLARTQLNDGSCQAALYKPRKSNTGWQQAHSLFKVSCATGLGSSPAATSVVDLQKETIDIYVAE